MDFLRSLGSCFQLLIVSALCYACDGLEPHHDERTLGRLHAMPIATIDAKPLKKAIKVYREHLGRLRNEGNSTELQLRPPFHDLLVNLADEVGWQFQDETATPGSGPRAVRPDGLLTRHAFPYGLWEAKGPKGNLEAEVRRKLELHYPTYNTLFENTRQAILYQHGRRFGDRVIDLESDDELGELLQTFFGYSEPVYEELDQALAKLRERVPQACSALLTQIDLAHKNNAVFQQRHAAFLDSCRKAINPHLDAHAADHLLVQHLMLSRLIDSIFHMPHFLQENAVAREISQVVDALTGGGFDRVKFLAELDRYFKTIEHAARTVDDKAPDADEAFARKQQVLNDVYEQFFQGWDTDVADTHGIVYTPQEIVDFMCASVVEVLKSEFGVGLGDPWVKVLDPCTGTGSFLVNLLRRIPPEHLEDAYRNRLFANEVQLLPYYVAALNIEHTYHERLGKHAAFPGLCFADTLDLVRQQQSTFGFLNPENTERVQREMEAPLTVIIGNPPYNVGQKNENDNNKNRRYRRASKVDPEGIDDRISATYAKESKATNKNALSDMYVKFFRWATDRLGKSDGVVCFVTNNSFVDNIAFDGMRKSLLEDFDLIDVIDLRGNVRQNPKLSGTAYNVFGIQIGVCVTMAIRKRSLQTKRLRFAQFELQWRRQEKLERLAALGSTSGVKWRSLMPDGRNTWLVSDGADAFAEFVPIGSKEMKSDSAEGVFDVYSVGIKTNRDSVVYGFRSDGLQVKINAFIEAFDYEVYRWRMRNQDESKNIDEFISCDVIQWSEGLKNALKRGRKIDFKSSKIRMSLYRPFTKRFVFFDDTAIERIYQFHKIFPVAECERENRVIVVSDIGYRAGQASTLMSDRIVDLHLNAAIDSHQCFPFHTYDPDGSNRRENITDWALEHFRSHYGETTLPKDSTPIAPEDASGVCLAWLGLSPDSARGAKNRKAAGTPAGFVTRPIAKWDIFHYVYAVLHHPTYRERFAEVLKKELPRVPLLPDFGRFVAIGRALGALHVHYENVPSFDLTFHWKANVKPSWRVESMRLSKDKTELTINDTLTLAGIPPEVFAYRLGNRSALDWVIDQYRCDPRTGEDPNRPDDERYIVDLARKVITVSQRTNELIKALPEFP